MTKLIFDIETAGEDFDALDKKQQEDIKRWAKEDEAELAKLKESTSFWPLTGQVVVIGMLNPDTNKGAVYLQAPNQEIKSFEENGILFESGAEKEILEKFWLDIQNYQQFISFNGRDFDIPFLMIRSAINGVKPSRNFFGGAYSGRYDKDFIDLADRLKFHGVLRHGFSLDWWCRAFKIKSPKEEMTGYQVKDFFKQGKYLEIARYCLGDLYATKELYEKWDKYLNFFNF